MNRAELCEDVMLAEGLRLHAYQDTAGVWTVGYGHAHVPPGTVWTCEQAVDALRADLDDAEAECERHLPWWREMDGVRQAVVCEMMFNMGWPRLSGFHDALTAMQAHDYERAAAALLDSRWASQVKGRAVRLAEQMRTGLRAQP